MWLTIGYFFARSRLVGTYIRPYRSVLPSRDLTVIGIGGFQPAARRREMSAVSSVTTVFPLRSRSTDTGGVSGVEYVSTKYWPDGASAMLWSAFSGVSSVRPVPSMRIL